MPLVARRRRVAPVVLLAAVTLALAGCAPGTIFPALDATDRRVPEGTLDQAAAAAALQKLVVTLPGRLSGYDRDCGKGQGCVFGPAWSDDVDVAGGHNGCDTRNDLLNRDLQAGQVGSQPVPKRHRESGSCVVVEGVLDDPYTGRTIHFVKEKADAVQIDHVVALAAAWRAGAANWNAQQRRNFANDPRNLLVVDGPTNQAKGDSTADEWQPPNSDYHCEFARIVITVKVEYGLTVTAAEQAALRAALERCQPPTPPPVTGTG